MRRSRLLVVFIAFCVTWQLLAQDHLPVHPLRDKQSGKSKQLRRDTEALIDTIAVRVDFPSVFRGMGRNEITDSLHLLIPVLERLRLVKAGISEDTVRMVHIGDSHIRGRVYPQTTANLLSEAFGLVSYIDMGVNGATCSTFANPERIAAIAALKPELLILSFGTNESHNRGYDANAHYQQIDELIKLLRASLPAIPILLTTPPGSFDSYRKRRRRSTYAVNVRTATAAKTIKSYASTHGLIVWDLYQVTGGSKRAGKNWLAAGLMRTDHVHYTVEGYTLQGELFYEAIIKAYNNYVSH